MTDELTKIAAECHRAKWRFAVSDEYLPSRREGHRLAWMAFEELHRIGNMALLITRSAETTMEVEMTDDLVKRLRDRDAIVIGGLFHPVPVMKEAADEIERLRAALQFVIDGYDNQDINHADYRIGVYKVAIDAMLSRGRG